MHPTRKKEVIRLSPMTKASTPTEKFKKQHDNTKTPPKTSITHRLRTDLGRSVGVPVTIATEGYSSCLDYVSNVMVKYMLSHGTCTTGTDL